MGATQLNLLDVAVATFRSFFCCDSTTHTWRCIDGQSCRDANHQNDFGWFQVDEPPKRDAGDFRLAQLVTILQLQDGLRKRCVVLLQEVHCGTQRGYLPSNGLLRVWNDVFCRNQADHVVVNIRCIWAAMHLIRIPSTRYHHVNSAINLVMFNRFWPKPLEAEGDMQTDNDDGTPEDYRRNRNASVDDEHKEDEVEEEEEVEEEHHDDE